MYWKTDHPDRPGWERESVIADLTAFRTDAPTSLTEETAAYCRYYGLDLWVEHPQVEYCLGILPAAGHSVAVHYFHQPSPRGTVFVLHGYFDHVGLYSQLIDRCLEAGFDVLAYDQPGHGLSSGPPAAIASFTEYQTVLADILVRVRTLPAPWYAVGQSTGGGVLIDYLLAHVPYESHCFRRVVLLAPLVRPMGWLGAKALHTMVKPFLSRWRRVFAANSNDSRFLSFLRDYDPLQARAVQVDWVSALRRWVPHIESARPVHFPITVVQGEKDLTVDWHHNLRILRNKFDPVFVRRLPDGRHHLANEAPDLQATVFNVMIQSFLDDPGEAQATVAKGASGPSSQVDRTEGEAS